MHRLSYTQKATNKPDIQEFTTPPALGSTGVWRAASGQETSILLCGLHLAPGSNPTPCSSEPWPYSPHPLQLLSRSQGRLEAYNIRDFLLTTLCSDPMSGPCQM